MEPYEFRKKHPNSLHFKRDTVEAFITKQKDKTIITFRGTSDLKDVLKDLKALPTETPAGKVHSGFFEGVEKISRPLMNSLDKYHDDENPIYITGHSKGGAEALLFASRLALIYDICVYTFGAPRVCNKEYKDLYESLIPHCYAFITDSDPVPRMPKYFIRYKRLGKEYWIDEDGGLHTKPSKLKRLWWFLWDTSRLNDHKINNYKERLNK